MDAIDRYLQESGKSLSGLAVEMGLAPSTLTRIANGEREPSFQIAEKIERHTEGKLPAGEFLAACLLRKRAALAEKGEDAA